MIQWYNRYGIYALHGFASGIIGTTAVPLLGYGSFLVAILWMVAFNMTLKLHVNHIITGK